MLKIYLNRQFTSSKLTFIPLLHPFLGFPNKPTTPILNKAYREVCYNKKFYLLVNNIEDADIAVLPHNYWLISKYDPELLEKIKIYYRDQKMKILIDASGDSDGDVNFNNSIIVRTCRFRRDLETNEIIIPALTEDLLKNYYNGRLVLRKKNSIPSVGFIGWSGWGFWQRLFNFSGLEKNGLKVRIKAIERLKQNKNIRTNFLVRNFYYGHTSTNKVGFADSRAEFVKNIFNNDYTLCARGSGNYSYRLYETLSLGRLPLYIDTHGVLPLEDKINYRDIMFILDIDEIDNLDTIFLKWHNALSDKEFGERQKMTRKVYENYLRIDSFTQHLKNQIFAKL